jgi:hypothetical protein
MSGYDEPSPDRGSKGALWGLLGVVGGVTLVCAGLLTIGIVAIYWLGRSAQQTLQRAAAEQEALAKQTHLMVVQAVADQFFMLVKQGREDVAYQQFTSKGFRERQSLEQFRAFIKKYPQLRDPDAPITSTPAREGATCTVPVTVKGRDGVQTFTLRVIEEDGTWKVDDITAP